MRTAAARAAIAVPVHGHDASRHAGLLNAGARHTMIAGKRPRLKVTQPGSRSILIVSDNGIAVHVPYHMDWNGHERRAESIVLTPPARSGRGDARPAAWEVRAFFLFGEIRDRITEDESGICVERSWFVKTTGSLHLSIDIELDAEKDFQCLFPGVHAAAGLPGVPLSFLGEKTSYPAGLLLSLGRKGVLVFSRSSLCEGAPASIGIARTAPEDEPSRLQVTTRFPGAEEPAGRIGPRPTDVLAPEDVALESPGNLERRHELFLVFASRGALALEGASSVLQRRRPRIGRKPPAEKSVDEAQLADALDDALSTHLVQAGGVTGMRETPGSPWVSSAAGLGCALALRKLFPGDARRGELSLRLAEFALKGQIPSGFFHESYSVESGRWKGVRGQTARTLLSLAQSAHIAELLLDLADQLSHEGRPFEKYYLAALRFVEFFLDEKGRLSMPGDLHVPAERSPAAAHPSSLGGLELFFPMASVYVRTGRDRYKKALDQLVKRFAGLAWDPFRPPSSREGRGPDSAGAQIAAALYLRMRGLGWKTVEQPTSSRTEAVAHAAEGARLFASLLVPWVRVHADEPTATHAPAGCIADSAERQRLVFSGNETALLLLRLGTLCGDAGVKSLLRSLARLCLSASGAAPLGTAWLQHTAWDAEGKAGETRGKRGPVDSRRLAQEVRSALAIAAEFPKI